MAVIGPWHIDVAPWMRAYSSVGSWTRTANSSNFTGAVYLSDGTLDNEIVYNVPLLAGTWTVSVIGITNSDYGISTVYFDGSSVGTMDWYSAGSTNNVVKSITSISQGSDAIVAVKFKMATKHASSSSYKFAPALITFSRTA